MFEIDRSLARKVVVRRCLPNGMDEGKGQGSGTRAGRRQQGGNTRETTSAKKFGANMMMMISMAKGSAGSGATQVSNPYALHHVPTTMTTVSNHVTTDLSWFPTYQLPLGETPPGDLPLPLPLPPFLFNDDDDDDDDDDDFIPPSRDRRSRETVSP